MPIKLTAEQKRLKKDIDEIAVSSGFNYNDLQDLSRGWRTFRLSRVKDLFIRSSIIADYILIDETLNSLIQLYYFSGNNASNYVERTKKFKIFRNNILDELYILNKLEIVKKSYRIPKYVSSYIHSLNTIRNALTHSFFPDRLEKKKPVYGKESIFLMSCFRRYTKDHHKTVDCLDRLIKYKSNGRWKKYWTKL